MNANVFKKSRRGWTDLWSRQSLGSWAFEVRVREGFVPRVGRATNSLRAAKGVDSPQPNIFWLIGIHLRSLAAKKKISS